MSNKITLVIIAKNEAKNLQKLLPLLNWAKVLVIDNDSTDETEQVIQNFGVEVVKTKQNSFAEVRNLALAMVKTDYLFYLDADERITQELKNEILSLINSHALTVGALRRKNYFYGEEIKYGGWQNDYVTRIFRKDLLKQWRGEIHESPEYEGSLKVLKSPLWHLTHRTTVDNLRKSSAWTIKEAKLIAAEEKKVVTASTIGRKMLMEFLRRYIRDQGYKDGRLGFIEALVQAMNRAMVYIQVWEKQQKPSIKEKYQLIEDEVVRRQ